MKTIGDSRDGGKIVQLSETEYKVLGRLSDAVEGRWHDDPFFGERRNLEQDFEKVFEVILAWVLLGFKVKDLRAFIEDIEKQVGVGEPEPTE